MRHDEKLAARRNAGCGPCFAQAGSRSLDRLGRVGAFGPLDEAANLLSAGEVLGWQPA